MTMIILYPQGWDDKQNMVFFTSNLCLKEERYFKLLDFYNDKRHDLKSEQQGRREGERERQVSRNVFHSNKRSDFCEIFLNLFFSVY